jgi:hypothetical protein
MIAGGLVMPAMMRDEDAVVSAKVFCTRVLTQVCPYASELIQGFAF